MVSKKNYRGINPLIFSLASMRHGFKSRWWATWNQWHALEGRVMRRPDHVPQGQWGATIVFFSPITKSRIDDDGEEVEDRFFVLRTYTVFNVQQVEGPFDHLRVGYHTVAEMARMLGLSRARLYQLTQAGVFPPPVDNVSNHRPGYVEELQKVCLEVRRRNCGINGHPVLFYAKGHRLSGQAKATRTVKRQPKATSRHADLMDALRGLGLTAKPEPMP